MIRKPWLAPDGRVVGAGVGRVVGPMPFSPQKRNWQAGGLDNS